MKIEFYYKYIRIPAFVILIIFSFFMIGWSRTTTRWELTFKVVDKETEESVDKVKIYYFALRDVGGLGGWCEATTDSEGLAHLYLKSFVPIKYIGFVFVDPEGRYKMQLFIPSEDNVRYTVRLSPNPLNEWSNSARLFEEITNIMSRVWTLFPYKDDEDAQLIISEIIHTVEKIVDKNPDKKLNPYTVIELIAKADVNGNDWIGFSDDDRSKGIIGEGKYIGPKENIVDTTKTLIGRFCIMPSDPTVFLIGFVDVQGNEYYFQDREKYSEVKSFIMNKKFERIEVNHKTTVNKKVELKEAIVGRAIIMWNVHVPARAQDNVIKKVKDIIILDE